MLPRVLFNIGFINIHTFGFTVAIGIALGTYFSFQLVKQRKISKELIIDILLYGFIAGIIGARLIYVLLNLPRYLAEPTRIIHIEAGGMSLHGDY